MELRFQHGLLIGTKLFFEKQMGSSNVLKPEDLNDGVKRSKKKQGHASKKASTTVPKENKRTSSQILEDPASCKRPKRAAACLDFKEKFLKLSEKSGVIETKRSQLVVEEAVAIRLTAGKEEGRPCRRLSDYVFHNSDGVPQPFEMLEVDDVYITGLILPLEGTVGTENDKGVRCEGFGRIEEWAISGYEEGSPVIWISTEIADYDCLKPLNSYRKQYEQFFAKATACIEVYKKLSKSSGGNPDLGLDELLAGIVRAMRGLKCFPDGASIRDFIISQGEFIYKQLHGLEETSRTTDQPLSELSVLIALKDECSKQLQIVETQAGNSVGALIIASEPVHQGFKENKSDSSNIPDEVNEDAKLARLLSEEEQWRALNQKKKKHASSLSSKYYIKINEVEIANDYPLPAYYKNSNQETDEYIVFDSGYESCYIDDLPRNVLHNWALYNSDSRLISLELLPMRPCDDIDVTIFGSGVMINDDGSGYSCDASSGSGTSGVEGMPIYLSDIKEWMIEFGSSVIVISIRTDMSWYRLGKPSKQYAPWYEPVLKTAWLAVSIITLLKEQARVARLSFSDVIKRVSEFEKSHPAYISSNSDAVERYVVVHGQIILQQFAEYPNEQIRKCAFLSGLLQKMEEKHHTKWLVKKKKVVYRNAMNLNPRAVMGPVVSKRKAMQATTTRLINRFWGEYYSNYSPEHSDQVDNAEVKEDEDVEEQEENGDDDAVEEEITEEVQKPISVSRGNKPLSGVKDIKWAGESAGKTPGGEVLYKRALTPACEIVVGGAVLLESDFSDDALCIYMVEYMFETLNGSKMFHGRMMLRGHQTVLGNAANDREVFLTNNCENFNLDHVKEIVNVDKRIRPWGHQHRKANAMADKMDITKAEERKRKGLSTEYYCKSLYFPQKGAFFSLPSDQMGLGSGFCYSCKLKDIDSNNKFEVNAAKTGFVYLDTEYSVEDYIYVKPDQFCAREVDSEIFKSGRNIGLRSYVVCQLLEIICTKAAKHADMDSTQVKIRRFYRPEDISCDKAYCSDVREIFYSKETHIFSVEAIEGKCEVRRRHELPCRHIPNIFDHIFFCEHLYDPSKGSVKQIPSQIKLRYSPGNLHDANAFRKQKGKCKEGESDLGVETLKEVSANRLATLDIFAGCGGLSHGLQQSGVSNTKWAIEYDEAAGEAFKLNHPEALVFVNNCNVILRAIMQKCGDLDDCVHTSEASELAAKLSEEELVNLPLPGQVDFINGGPPCQGFSGMNRFNQSTWSKVQCEMILAFLSFADYYRPKYFLLENVRNFVSFNQGQTFRLTIASLLEMGYQVRFGILEAGAFGVSQSRKRAFIWAAAPQEVLPEWPEPMHVFAAPELKISLSGNLQYAAVRSTASGAPFRALTVRDTIGDLPPVGNGASNTNIEYQSDPVSWFQKRIRGNSIVLSDHISKEMNELNLIRCQRIPKRPGADWRDLPDEKVTLSTGQVVDLIPWCLPNTAKRHNQWKGLFGRLDWQGNFPTSITDPQPMGKVGMCFHPEQDRIVTVRECARSQGFPDSYKFAGNILCKHRQIGNAVPPPLAYALGLKLKEAVDKKMPPQ